MIKSIIEGQKSELERKFRETYIERQQKEDFFRNDLIKVIIGPRRAGKSFFAIHFLKAKGNFGYANFDDEKLAEVKDYDEIIEEIKKAYGSPKTLLLDEVQNLPKWELFVNRLQRQGFNLVITGSNSNLLSKELSTHLTGRHEEIHIFPFSLQEYLELFSKDKKLTALEAKERFSEYLEKGGYPEPAIKDISYKDYLSTLFNSIVYKDIVKRYNIRQAAQLDNLSYYLLSNISSEYSYNSLMKNTKIKSVHTIQKHLRYLEDAFIFFNITRFSYKIKEQISSNKKIYCFDNGFIHAKAFGQSRNIGRKYENLVAIELKKQEMKNSLKMFYWKNPQQEEVDFVVKKGTKITSLIQACYDAENKKTLEREVRALIKAGKELNCKELIVISEKEEKTEEKEWFGIKAKIKYISFQSWLESNR